MYIRNRDEALAAVGEILDLPERRDQIVASTIKIMLCTDEEPRTFLGDCQRLLIEGGLEALRRERREMLESAENLPIVVLDPQGDALFEAVASSLDALRLTEIAREAFSGLGGGRWRVARALLANEGVFREILSEAIRSREAPEALRGARRRMETLIVESTPVWQDRIGAVRTACLEVLKGEGWAQAEHSREADRLFELLATRDAWAMGVLEKIERDPVQAGERVLELYEVAQAVRSLEADGSASSGKSQAGP